jgi:hypothetical protein
MGCSALVDITLSSSDCFPRDSECPGWFSDEMSSAFSGPSLTPDCISVGVDVGVLLDAIIDDNSRVCDDFEVSGVVIGWVWVGTPDNSARAEGEGR